MIMEQHAPARRDGSDIMSGKITRGFLSFANALRHLVFDVGSQK